MSHSWRDLFSTVLPAGLVFMLALITGILSKTLLIDRPFDNTAQQNVIEMSGVEIVHTKFANNKHSLSVINADQIEYTDQQVNFLKPKVISYIKNQDLIEITSTKATSDSDMEVVKLSGLAEIKRLDNTGAKILTVNSEMLVFDVSDKTVTTDREVYIEQNTFKIEGKGMLFDQNRGTLEVKEKATLKSRSN